MFVIRERLYAHPVLWSSGFRCGTVSKVSLSGIITLIRHFVTFLSFRHAKKSDPPLYGPHCWLLPVSHITAHNLASAVRRMPSKVLLLPTDPVCTGKLGGPQSCLVTFNRSYTSCPCQELNHNSSGVQCKAQPLDWLTAMLASTVLNNQHTTGKDLSHYKIKLFLDVMVCTNNYRKGLQGQELHAHT
jgi:hypothetical protein